MIVLDVLLAMLIVALLLEIDDARHVGGADRDARYPRLVDDR